MLLDVPVNVGIPSLAETWALYFLELVLEHFEVSDCLIRKSHVGNGSLICWLWKSDLGA